MQFLMVLICLGRLQPPYFSPSPSPRPLVHGSSLDMPPSQVQPSPQHFPLCSGSIHKLLFGLLIRFFPSHLSPSLSGFLHRSSFTSGNCFLSLIAYLQAPGCLLTLMRGYTSCCSSLDQGLISPGPPALLPEAIVVPLVGHFHPVTTACLGKLPGFLISIVIQASPLQLHAQQTRISHEENMAWCQCVKECVRGFFFFLIIFIRYFPHLHFQCYPKSPPYRPPHTHSPTHPLPIFGPGIPLHIKFASPMGRSFH